MNTVEGERNNDKSMKEEEKKSGDDLDHFLKYGKYQALRVWIFGSILGICTAFSDTLHGTLTQFNLKVELN